ncbi:hypothetical protein [Streptomyces spectabilis]|uniref:Uncharacterized protein n=1 Tax=Streptomyces spectabilis TaxID=68270 RepID=A0A516RH91_STRST|nr:hypothetical protein [Streptomyces spectabilis]QDQ15016.1 hypothetical protein FH965_34415 [Streptomyces spectabilis]
MVYQTIPSEFLVGTERRLCYFVKGDRVLQFDLDEGKPLGGARGTADTWPGLKDGSHFRIRTQKNMGNATPVRTSAAPSTDLPFTGDDIAAIGFRVDEYDLVSADDWLARDVREYHGKGSYDVTTSDGSVTVAMTVTAVT